MMRLAKNKKKFHAMKAVHVHPKHGPSRHRSRRHS
jgi:hypothetical protein